MRLMAFIIIRCLLRTKQSTLELTYFLLLPLVRFIDILFSQLLLYFLLRSSSVRFFCLLFLSPIHFTYSFYVSLLRIAFTYLLHPVPSKSFFTFLRTSLLRLFYILFLSTSSIRFSLPFSLSTFILF